MNVQKGSLLKFVLDKVPPGYLVDSRWLAAHGVGRNSVHDYAKKGWLESVARGVYRRPLPDKKDWANVDWRLAVLSAQSIMAYDFHVGGMTALSLDGQSHYLNFSGKERVYLYGHVPNWLSKLDLDGDVKQRGLLLFGKSLDGVENKETTLIPDGQIRSWSPPLLRSTPERAILEALNEVPDEESFHVIDMAFQSLTNLRPKRLNALLQRCTSVKAKRLFFLFSDRHQHQWRSFIDKEAVDLGSGPRMLVEGGKYAAGYGLMVPPEYAGLSESDDDGA